MIAARLVRPLLSDRVNGGVTPSGDGGIAGDGGDAG
jgi:hypothetical protein